MEYKPKLLSFWFKLGLDADGVIIVVCLLLFHKGSGVLWYWSKSEGRCKRNLEKLEDGFRLIIIY